MLKKIPCIILMSLPGLISAAEITKQIELTLKVNVLKPVCKLSSGQQTINFGDFDVLDVITKSSKVNVALHLDLLSVVLSII